MNRMDEYTALLAELEQAPEELNHTVNKALNRKNALQKKRRFFGTSLGGLAACFAAFVLLVNLSTPFARACGRIPLLADLAKAVSWSPSLSAAVENDYVQPLRLSQSQNGITARVEYLIVDRKQVDVFFSIQSDDYAHLDLDHPTLTVPEEQEGYASSFSSYGIENGDLMELRIDFMNRDVPDSLTMTFGVYDNKHLYENQKPPARSNVADYGDELLSDNPREQREILATFTFELRFDPTYTEQGTVIDVGETFLLDGQSVTLTEAEIYPTHLRLNFDYDPANTAWLTDGAEFLSGKRAGRAVQRHCQRHFRHRKPGRSLHGFRLAGQSLFLRGGTPDPPRHRGRLDRQGTGAGEGRSGKGHDRGPAPRRPSGMGGEAGCRLGGVLQRRGALGENDALPDLEKPFL